MAQLPSPEGLSNDIYQYGDEVTIKSDFEFYGLEIDYTKLEETQPRLKSKLPNSYAMFYTHKKIIFLKVSHEEYNYNGIETSLFSHNKGFIINNVMLCTKELDTYNLQVHLNELENWETLSENSEWDNVTRNWEDIKGDAKSNRLRWHTISDFDKDARKTTYKKELRKK